MSKTSMRRVVIFIVVVAGLRLGGCVVTKPLIFPAGQSTIKPSVEGGELIQIRREDHERTVYAFFAKRGPRLVVFFHGNGAPMAADSAFARRLAERNFSILLVEYPGYGVAKEYKPSENVIYADSEIALRYARDELGFAAERTTLWGRSLGTGVATEMAGRGFARNVVLVSPYTSIPAVASEHYVPVLPYLVISDGFYTHWKAGDIRQPVLIIHGNADRTIPVDMGRELHEEFPNSRFLELKGAGHNDLGDFLRPSHWDEIVAFIENES